MRLKILIVIGLISSTLLPSCKKYLDVKPKSSLSEDELFSSEVGFRQALTGVYSQMASRNLYGDLLSMSFVSVLAQNYTTTGSSAPFGQTKLLNYTSGEVIGYTNSIWNSSYSAIAGLNKIIINSEEKRNVLSAYNYAMIRGEALALRAYLHFELLRLFGPEFSAGKALKAIPYKKTADNLAIVPSTTAEVTNQALSDLAEAVALLKGQDPIQFSSPSRQTRMNYFAAKGLEARIRIYMGDKPGAFSAAQTVVDSGKFPFVTVSQASAAAGFKDRLYLSEQVFCLRVGDIKNWAEQLYFGTNANPASKLTRTAAEFATLYESSSTDIRFVNGIESGMPSKFWQTYSFNTLDSNRLDQNVPLIRVSEMYYIMAEAAPTVAEGVGYLNAVRQNRALANLPTTVTATALTTEIRKEYQKEFYAEGQLFYYYKRNKVARMQFMTRDIQLSSYVLPIPQSELEFNPNY